MRSKADSTKGSFKIPPPSAFVLDEYEAQIEAEAERGEWQPVPEPEFSRLKAEFEEAARRTMEMRKKK